GKSGDHGRVSTWVCVLGYEGGSFAAAVILPGGNGAQAMTKMKQSIAPEIAAAAADWIVRHDGGELSAEDEKVFAQWHARPENREALARLKKVWDLLGEEEDVGKVELADEMPRQRAAV